MAIEVTASNLFMAAAALVGSTAVTGALGYATGDTRRGLATGATVGAIFALLLGLGLL